MNTALRAARVASGKTQAQVACEVGIREQAYQLYEYGKAEPKVGMAIKIAKVLQTDVETLFADYHKPTRTG